MEGKQRDLDGIMGFGVIALGLLCFGLSFMEEMRGREGGEREAREREGLGGRYTEGVRGINNREKGGKRRTSERGAG